MKNGIELIADERKRQIEVEKYSLEHDTGYENDELAKAASCYAMPESTRSLYPCAWRGVVPEFFPDWDIEFWKPTPEDRVKELVKAGALIAAEIDRIQATQ